MTTKNPLDRLATLGEEMLGKAAQSPATSKLLQSALQLKERVDDLSKRVRGLEAMEKRIDQLEKRVEKLESKPKATTKSSSSSAKKT